MNQKAAFLDTIAIATLQGMPMGEKENPVSLAHICQMWARLENANLSDAKVGRWLGWAQCAVVAGGYATLDDMKTINMRHA